MQTYIYASETQGRGATVQTPTRVIRPMPTDRWEDPLVGSDLAYLDMGAERREPQYAGDAIVGYTLRMPWGTTLAFDAAGFRTDGHRGLGDVLRGSHGT